MSRQSKLLIGVGIIFFLTVFVVGIRHLTSVTTNPPLGVVVKLAKTHFMTMDVSGKGIPAREFEFYDREKYPSLLVPLQDDRGNTQTVEVKDDVKLSPGSFRLVQRHVQERVYEGVHYPGYDYVVAEYNMSQPSEPQNYIPRVKPRR